ncbi:hypothetical protein [Agaribacter flavus]|uniref:Uncharacterized protein n=1 Tax=Agaribacter flavus TaxID=1902781 RepID=A0ABV7FRF9_9ALTE
MKKSLVFLLSAMFVCCSTTLLAQDQVSGKDTKSNKMTKDDYDNYWKGKGNPDMSAAAVAITSPKSVYLEEDGYIVLECEDAQHNENWVRMDSGKGYFGKAYLKYVGKNLQGNFDGHNTDVNVKYQQDIEDRLVFPIRITHPGTYRARLHLIHHDADGDNDAWVNLMRTPRRATRLGGKQPSVFHWNKFGWDGENLWNGKFNTFEFTVPGDYFIYIAGRSTGLGADRLVLHLDDKQEIAMSKSTPPSKRVAK